MYILMISRGIPSAKDPQWGCFEQDQAEALSEIGHKVVVISVDSRTRFTWRKIGFTYVKKNNVNFIDLFLIPGSIVSLFGDKTNFKFRNWQFLFLMKKVIKKFGRPNIIYAHYYHAIAHGSALKLKYDIPLVGIEHAGIFNLEKIPDKIKFRADIAYRYVDTSISVCHTLAERLKYHYGIDSKVVHNPVGKEFKYLSKDRKNEKFVFITVGSLLYLKGFDLLIPAFIKAGLPKNSWEMKIVGAGDEETRLRELIRKNDLTDNILLLGRKTKNEISKLLNESNVFILPSRMENFSVAILEALACGLPVISSEVGGVRECISELNGLLFPVDDVDSLSGAIIQMYTKYDSYDRKKIADDCQNRFSSTVIANQLTNVFSSVLNK